MKAQMSLEMVIGLLILLVVAAVVINLFLANTKVSVKDYTNSLVYRNFKSNCASLCSDAESAGTVAALAKYCYTKLSGNTDLNGNGKVDAIPAETKLLNVCEDGLYCFMVSPCQTTDGTTIDWGDCRQILCNAYYQVYNDYSVADQKVKQFFPNGIGSCTLPADQANWYNLYFGNNPCTQGPIGTTATSSPSPTSLGLVCKRQGNTGVCNYSCPNQVNSTNYAAIALKISPPQGGTLINPSGTYTFGNLVSGTTYQVVLDCNPTEDGLINAVTSV